MKTIETSTEAKRLPQFNTIDTEDIKGLVIPDYVQTYDLPSDAKAIAWGSRTGEPCAYTRRVGEGNATLLGFKPFYMNSSHDDHRCIIQNLLIQHSVQKKAYAENIEAIVIERRCKEYA